MPTRLGRGYPWLSRVASAAASVALAQLELEGPLPLLGL